MTRRIPATPRGLLPARCVGLLALLATVGCAAPPAAAPAAAPAASPSPPPAAAAASTTIAPLNPPVTVNVAITGGAGEIGAFLALERGYFAEEGLKMDVQEFRSAADIIAPLSAGQLDVGNGGINAGLFNAIAQGIPLKIVANQVMNTTLTQATVWMVRSELMDSGRFKSAADLRGLNVALGGSNTIADIDLDQLLKEGGLTRADIEIKLIPYADQITAFANGSIDVAYVFEPTRTRILEQGTARSWKTSGQINPDHETSVVLFGPTMTEGDKFAAGQRYITAYIRGVREARREIIEQRTDAGLSVLAKYSTLKDIELWRKMEFQATDPNCYNHPESIERDIQWFKNAGVVQHAPTDFIDSRFCDYAIGRLGRYTP
jgi:NitT/TauT family transport system substrate-binding protein